MLIVNVQSNLKTLTNQIDTDQREQRVASARALNVAARGLRTDASRELRKRYPKLRNKDISDLLQLQFASQQNLQAVVAVRGRPLSLMRFLASESKKKGGGAWVNVKGNRKFIKGAWVQDMRSKSGDEYQVLFVRAGKGRFPIKALRTIDIPNAMNIAEVRTLLDQLVQERFDKEFARQLTVVGGI